MNDQTQSTPEQLKIEAFHDQTSRRRERIGGHPPPRFGQPRNNEQSKPCFLVPCEGGWILMTPLGSARSVLRISHGWTKEAAEECVRILDGDVLL